MKTTFMRIIFLMFLLTGIIEVVSAFKENPIYDHTSCGVRVPDVFPTDSSTYPGEFPWNALIGYKNTRGTIDYACAGSLISDRYVLTAALCTNAQKIAERTLLHVRFGDFNIDTEVDSYQIPGIKNTITTRHVDVQIEETVSHPMYNMNGPNSNDIGLIRLSKTLNFQDYDGFISPICLPFPEDNPYDLLKNAEVAGWDFVPVVDRTDFNIMKQSLRVEEVSVCQDLFVDYDAEKQICMVPIDNINRCVGYSGSSLSVPDDRGTIIVGILSYGQVPCSEARSVFTSVAYYREWILQNLRP